MSVEERALKAFETFTFKIKFNGIKFSKEKDIKNLDRPDLNYFQLANEALKVMNDQKPYSKVRLYDLLQLLTEPSKGAVIYEILKADEFNSMKYADRMNYAKDYVMEVSRAMACRGCSAYIADVRALSPVVVGRGFLDLALEYGMAWDPVLDLPYVPASELKGAMRSLLLKAALSSAHTKGLIKALDITGKTGGKVLTKEEQEALKNLVGNEEPVVAEGDEHSGWISISDAYPVNAGNGVPVELLVITPHYTPNVHQEYDVRPNPIKHLGIARETELMFAVSVSSQGWSALKEILNILGLNGEPENLLRSIIKETLLCGIGRRTSRGMGRMNLVNLDEVNI